MQTGIKWLVNNFPGIEDKITTLWQIDPFGSSEITPLLFNSKQDSTAVKFKYAVLNRIGDITKERMKEDKQMEFIWKN